MIERVVFSLDRQSIGSRAGSPFAMSMRAAPGAHQVRVRITFKDSTSAKTVTMPYEACAAAPRVAASQPLVVLLHDHVARSAPSAHVGRVEAVAARRPLTRARTVLPVLGGTSSPGAGSWLRVRLPGRPNGHAGWISTNRTRQTSTPWGLRVKLSTRRLTVYRGGHVRRQFRAVIGKPSTPTPRGPSSSRRPWPSPPTKPAARSRWPPAPGRTSSRNSRVDRGRSPSTGPTTSAAPPAAPHPTDVSASARERSPGWRGASAPACR